MKFVLAIPSKSLNDPMLLEGVAYLERLRPPFTGKPYFINPKIPASAPVEKRKALEGRELLEKTEGHFRCALTETGKRLSSEDFATMLQKLMHSSAKSAFIIGGAFGLSDEVIKSSDMTLSLSPMTMPHRMAFLVLAEQLYRAGEIISGSPYHK